LPVTTTISEYAGNLRGFHRTKGRVRHQADMLIAATAKIHDLTLVTRNTKDFDNCGIAILNPFEQI
jgi:toxin FitB